MSDFDSRLRRFSEALLGACFRPVWGLSVAGLDLVPRKGCLIVAFNHASLLDGPLVGTALGGARRPVFLAKRELFSIPLVGRFLQETGVISLDRESPDHGALRAALAVLRQGGSIALSPEGTRVRKGQRREPKLGVSFLAAKSGAAVLPVRLVGTADFPWTYPIEVRCGTLMRPAGEGRQSGISFARAVMDAIYSL